MWVMWLLLWTVLIYLAWRVKKIIDLVRVCARIPSPKFVFPFGHVYELMSIRYEDLNRFLKNLYKDFPNQSISPYWATIYPGIAILKASAAEKVLRSTNALNKSYLYVVVQRWLGEGLLTCSTRGKWTRDRKLLTPSFHYQILNTFINIFNEKSLILMSKLSKHGVDGDVFNMFPYLNMCTLDVICDAAMGKNINAQNRQDTAYVKSIVMLSELAAKRFCFPWLMIPFIYKFTPWGRKESQCLKVLHGFTNQVIKERRADRKKQKMQNPGLIQPKEEQPMGLKTRNRFLDMLLDISDADGRMTDTEIREQVDTFMFGGHDTIACSLNWTIYFIGRHPTVQQKVQAELDDIFMNDNERAVTSADIIQMKYIEAVIKESMRMIPIVPMFGRVLETEMEFDGHVIPSGAQVMIMSHYIHRDPDIYDQPDIFDPDRFLFENKMGRHPYGFLGFSAGPRNCLGQKFALMEEKVILAHLLRKYSVVSTDKFEDLEIGASIVAKPLSGTHIKLHPRINSDHSGQTL